jgi:hypothetical protein
MMNREGFRRKWWWPARDTVTKFACRKKTRTTSVNITGVPFENRTENLQSKIVECYRYKNALIAQPRGQDKLGVAWGQLENSSGSVIVSCCYEKLVAEAGNISETQMKGNIRRRKQPLPSNDIKD